MKTILIKTNVRCEPELEATVCGMRPAARRILAKKLSRWAHQLELTATVIERREFQDGVTRPKLRSLRIEVSVKN